MKSRAFFYACRVPLKCAVPIMLSGWVGLSFTHAADILWDAGPSGTGADWLAAENWTGDVLPTDNITTDNAVFNGLTVGQPVLDGPRSVAGVDIPTSTGGWTLGGTGTLTLGSKGIDSTALENGTNTISVANAPRHKVLVNREKHGKGLRNP